MQLSKFKSDPLDSCEKSLVKTRSSETVGDYLCAQVERFIGKKAEFKAAGKDNIKIPIYYSACGGDWTPVSDNGTDLYVEEPLCCTKTGKFRRCDGTDFADSC